MRFPGLLDDAKVRSLLTVGMQAVKTVALKDLSTLQEKARGLRAEDVARMLSMAADRYAEWRARLTR